LPKQGVKPHLFGFDKLTSSILFRGKEVVPAEEIAEKASDMTDSRWWVTYADANHIIVTDDSSNYMVHIFSSYNIEFQSHWSDSTLPVENQVTIVDLLREMQFAVGFQPGEYIEKEIKL